MNDAKWGILDLEYSFGQLMSLFGKYLIDEDKRFNDSIWQKTVFLKNVLYIEYNVIKLLENIDRRKLLNYNCRYNI